MWIVLASDDVRAPLPCAKLQNRRDGQTDRSPVHATNSFGLRLQPEFAISHLPKISSAALTMLIEGLAAQ